MATQTLHIETNAARALEEKASNVPHAGDDASTAIARLVESHGPRLYALATRLCRHAADAEDMVQDVFLQAYRKWHTFKGNSSPGTWLYAIAARSCKARMRRKGGVDRRVPAISQLMPWGESQNLTFPASNSTQPVEAVIGRESEIAVHQAIISLPEHFRVPLVLKEMLELSIDEVAEALRVKPETIKTRVHRARLLLRKAIMERPRVPKHEAVEPVYERQVCLDLLKAKLEAMDQERGFPVDQSVVCERCRSVFAELDLAQNTCAHLAEGTMPARVRELILRAIRDSASNAKDSHGANARTTRSTRRRTKTRQAATRRSKSPVSTGKRAPR